MMEIKKGKRDHRVLNHVCGGMREIGREREREREKRERDGVPLLLLLLLLLQQLVQRECVVVFVFSSASGLGK